MRGRKRRSFDFGNFEITKREILVSVSIVAIMLLIGVLIAGKISDYQLDKNEKLNFPSLKTAAKAAYSSQTTIYL